MFMTPIPQPATFEPCQAPLVPEVPAHGCCRRCDALAMAETLPAALPRLRSVGRLDARDPRTGTRLRDLVCDDCSTQWLAAFDGADAMVEWQVAPSIM